VPVSHNPAFLRRTMVSTGLTPPEAVIFSDIAGRSAGNYSPHGSNLPS
jgi:hypothetical protein